MNIFEFFEVIISQKTDLYESITEKEKNGFAYLLNRYMSAEYPLHAHELNKTQVSGNIVVDFWRGILLKKRYNKVPGFFFLKTSSKHSKDNKKLDSIKAETLNRICIHEKIKKSELIQFINLNSEISLELIKKYEKSWKKI